MNTDNDLVLIPLSVVLILIDLRYGDKFKSHWLYFPWRLLVIISTIPLQLLMIALFLLALMWITHLIPSDPTSGHDTTPQWMGDPDDAPPICHPGTGDC